MKRICSRLRKWMESHELHVAVPGIASALVAAVFFKEGQLEQSAFAGVVFILYATVMFNIYHHGAEYNAD